MGKLRKLSLGKKILIGIVIGLAIGFISPKAGSKHTSDYYICDFLKGRPSCAGAESGTAD